MLPMLHCEKFISPVSATGLMMNCELASQVLCVSGQHVGEPADPQPSAHYELPLVY